MELAELADRLFVYGAQLGVPNPTVSLLAACRRAALDEALARFQPQAGPLCERIDGGEHAARAELAALATAALDHLRLRTHAHAREHTPVHALLAWADRRWRETSAGEHIDDPQLDAAARTRAMANLDFVNALIGSYAAFFELIRPLLAGRGGRPLRVLELAAGHGGFALSLARTARARGHAGALELTATDIMAEYLELGRREAAAEGLPVRFAVQDALDLRNFAAGEFDLIVCTQSIHHFEPGAVAVMLHEATRVAGRGILLIDGARTLLHAPPLWLYMRARLRDPVIAHDGWVSCRRFFVPEELLLLARLLPRGEHATARWMPPTHCVLELATG